jgi:ppGpp synthetase/RelA/SpoT-type nucleotidyltranferase
VPADSSIIESALKEFQAIRHLYEGFGEALCNLIRHGLDAARIPVDQITFRAKPVTSLRRKLLSDEKYLEDPLAIVTDLTGVRVLVHYKDDVERVMEFIRQQLVVDRKYSVDDRNTVRGGESVCVRVHGVVKLKGPRRKLPEWRDYRDFRAEIQVRTVAQHAWYVVSRKYFYPESEKNAPDLLRGFLDSAWTTLASVDDTFISLRKVIQAHRHEESDEAWSSVKIESLSRKALEKYCTVAAVVGQFMEAAIEAGYTQSVWRESEVGLLTEELFRLCIAGGYGDIREIEDLLQACVEERHSFFAEVISLGEREPGDGAIGCDPVSIVTEILIAYAEDSAFKALKGVVKGRPAGHIEKVRKAGKVLRALRE